MPPAQIAVKEERQEETCGGGVELAVAPAWTKRGATRSLFEPGTASASQRAAGPSHSPSRITDKLGLERVRIHILPPERRGVHVVLPGENRP